MSTQKKDQKQEKDQIPVIRPDIDKLRHMSFDRKDLIEAFASDYEDTLRETAAELSASIDEKIDILNNSRLSVAIRGGSSFAEAMNDCITEQKDFLSALIKEAAKLEKIDKTSEIITYLSNVPDSSVSERMLVRENILSAAEDVLEIREKNKAAKGHDPFINKKAFIDNAAVQISFFRKSGNQLSDKTVSVDIKISCRLPKKESEKLIDLRNKTYDELIDAAVAYLKVQQQIKELPNVLRRMKARLTKKTMGESVEGRKILEYFSTELSLSKEQQNRTPAVVKDKK